jgi:hypothetical protein
MSAIVALIIQNLPAILATGQAGISWIAHVRQAAQQSGEWTPQAEEAFTQSLLHMALEPQWRPDPIKAA